MHGGVPDKALRNWGDFRKSLMRRESFDPDKFGTPEDISAANDPGGWFDVPAELNQWSLSSRRVYSLSADLQLLLEATTLEKLCYSDIHLPFPSFGISLATPFRMVGEASCDFILVTSDVKSIKLRYLGKSCDRTQRVPQKLVERASAALTAGRAIEQKRIFEEMGRYCEGYTSTATYFLMEGNLRIPATPALFPLESFINLRKSETKEGLAQALNDLVMSDPKYPITLVIGLGLYLKGLSSKPSARHANWNGPGLANVDPRTIVSDSQVCSVGYEGTISEYDRQFVALIREKGLERAIKEMGVHFRSAHWRRPVGLGQDPTASRTVRVSSTMVRPDRLPTEGVTPTAVKEVG